MARYRPFMAVPAGRGIRMGGMASADLASAAEAMRVSGDVVAAKKLANRALKVSDRTSGRGWHVALRCLGTMAWDARDLVGAAGYYGRAVDHRRRETPLSTQGLVVALDDLAVACYYLRLEDDALELRREALRRATGGRIGDPPLLRKLRRRLAQSYQSRGFMEEAEKLYRRCRPTKKDSIEDRIGWTNAMALVAEDKGEIAESAKWFDEVIDMLDDVGRAEGLAAALGNAVQTRLELGYEREAAVQMRRLRDACRTDRKLASLLALADTRMAFLAGRKRFEAALRVAGAAERLISRAVEDDRLPPERPALRAMLLRLADRPNEAEALILTHLPPPGARDVRHLPLMVELAEIHVLRRTHEPARRLLVEAVTLDTGRETQDCKWRLFSLLAGAAELAERPRAAIMFGKMALIRFRHAARGLGGSELDGWLRPRMAVYTKILNRLTIAGRDPEAVSLQLRRTQELSLELATRQQGSGATVDEVPFRPGEAELWRRYLELHEALRPRLKDLPAGRKRPDGTAQVEALLTDIYEERFDLPRPADAFRQRAMQGAGHPCLAFLPSGDTLHAVLSGPEGDETFDIGRSVDELAGEIRTLRSALQSGEGGWEAPARALYDALIRPFAARIEAARRFDVVASGMIGYVPFPVLFDGSRFLVEKAAPCFRTGQRREARPPRSGAGWVTATFATAAGGELPAAVPEAREIATRSGGRALVEGEFTLAAVQAAVAGGANLLHLATHFIYVPGQPHRSRLLFGDGRWLSLSELAGAELDLSGVELVVLSGCDTGISDGLDLGLEGLAGLLQAKGAHRVVATLWQISDAGAKALMSGFYDRLLAAPASDPVAALAEAQAALAVAAGEREMPPPLGSGIGARGDAVRGWSPGEWGGFAIFEP